MAENNKSRFENAKLRRRRTKRVAIIIVVALLVGAGAGVGMNFLLAEPKSEESATEDTTQQAGTEDNAESTDTGGDTAEPEETRKTPLFDVSQAMPHIFALSEQIGSRPAGSGKESSSATYIVQRLAEYGYTVEEQPFTMPDGYGTRNIVGTKSGTRDGFVIVVGAHYDSSASTGGAVDNASGVGVVLELARVFNDTRLEPTLKFVFFGANRPGISGMDNRLLGSRRFVEMLGSIEMKEYIGMIAVDSVAQGDYMTFRTQETGLQRLKDKMATYAQEQDIQSVKLKSASDSDNIPFEDAQIPAVWVEWCDAGGKQITDDTYGSVLAEKVESAGTLIERFLLDLTSDDLEELKY